MNLLKMNRHRGSHFKGEMRRETSVVQMLQANKREWTLMGFVFVLFLLIVAVLATVYHLQLSEPPPVHQSHNATVSLTELHMEIRNKDGEIVLLGELWKNIPQRPTPFHCSNPEGLCLLWKNIKKLEVEHFESGLGTCHRILWSALSQDRQDHADCFGLGDDVRWYGGGLLKRESGTLESLSLPRQPLVTTNVHDTGTFGSVVERYWLSSAGVAILVDPESSFEFSINAYDDVQNATDRQLCLYSGRQGPVGPYANRNGTTGLNYTICVSDNIGQVRVDTLPMLVRDVVPKHLPDFLFESLVWSTWAYLKDTYNQSDLSQFSEQIVTDGFSRGLFIIDDGWQEAEGDLEFAFAKFPRPKILMEDLHAKGFHVSLKFRMQVSAKSRSFHNATVQNSMVRDFSGDVPSLTRWWNGPHIDETWNRGLAGIIDLKSLDAAWLVERLRLLWSKYGVDAFHVSGNEVSSLPAHSGLLTETADPNERTQQSADLVTHFEIHSSTESASRNQQSPVLFRLNGGTSTWNGTGGLHTIIPNAIALGLLGYPFFIPDPVGGSAYEGSSPSRELYVRWLQVSAFLPIVHLSIPPTLYDSEVQTIVKNILGLRASLVLPEVLRIVRDHGGSAQFPVVRPIWWIDPLDREALQTLTEFLVGNNILVAPILAEGAVQRDIYLPKGVWHDPVLGVGHSGPVWLRSYNVSLSSVAYFIRQ